MDHRAEAGHDRSETALGERLALQPDLRRPGDRRPREVSVRLYLLGAGALAERVRAAADIPPEDAFPDAPAFLPLEGHTPGVILLPSADLPPEEVVAVLRACLRSPGRWTPAFVEVEEDGVQAFPLSPTRAASAEDLARFARTGEGSLVLRLEDVLERLRAARHEINNPLAAALVEVQLLLMDHPGDETRRAFGVVEDQLRRIKELVSRLTLPAPPGRQDAGP